MVRDDIECTNVFIVTVFVLAIVETIQINVGKLTFDSLFVNNRQHKGLTDQKLLVKYP